jgi:hypothetical protein
MFGAGCLWLGLVLGSFPTEEPVLRVEPAAQVAFEP